jgi:ribosome assembly protein 1
MRCLKDLRERFAKIEITASKPLVPFRETLKFAPALNSQTSTNALGRILKNNSDNSIAIGIRVIPMPPALRQFLFDHQKGLSGLEGNKQLKDEMIEVMKDVVRKDLKDSRIPDIGLQWDSLLENVLFFGTKEYEPNLLCLDCEEVNVNTKFDYQSNVALGFQMGTASGPLCGEPMAGTVIIVEKFQVDSSVSDHPLAIPGQIVSILKDSIKQGFLHWSPRLMLAMYSCEIQTDPKYLGSANEVISRRKGKILAEDVKDGTMLFTISAILPIIESFGFVEEIRTNTSGVAQPQLLFHGYEVLDEDPFWVPSTEEELEDLGEIADRDNLAKKYMESVRLSKGMEIERRMVDPEKQRNLRSK